MAFFHLPPSNFQLPQVGQLSRQVRRVRSVTFRVLLLLRPQLARHKLKWGRREEKRREAAGIRLLSLSCHCSPRWIFFALLLFRKLVASRRTRRAAQADFNPTLALSLVVAAELKLEVSTLAGFLLLNLDYSRFLSLFRGSS